MKRCVTAIDLSEHYQEVHTEHETRGQELLSDSSVTVGPLPFVLAAWLRVAQNSFLPLSWCWFPFKLQGNMDCFYCACLREESVRKKSLG